MDGNTPRLRTPDWLRTSFWADVELELGRIEPLELSRFERADRGPAARTRFECELWERLKPQLPT